MLKLVIFKYYLYILLIKRINKYVYLRQRVKSLKTTFCFQEQYFLLSEVLRHVIDQFGHKVSLDCQIYE